MKIKEAEWTRDENLFETDDRRLSYFSSVAGVSVGFSDIISVSLAFFGSFLGNAKKNKNIDKY